MNVPLNLKQRRSLSVLFAVFAVGGLWLSYPVASPALAVTFTDVTRSAGVDYVQHQQTSSAYRQTFMTGGAAAGDYDGDGWIDLYVTCIDGPDTLFRNQQNGTFANATVAAFGASAPVVASNGAQWGDIYNDGDQDLYVTSIDPNGYQLFINNGAGQFTEEAVARGASISGADAHFGMSSAFGDYDGDGYLDMHVTEWREDYQVAQGTAFNSRLLRNLGAANPGHFEDVTVAAGVAMENVPTSNDARFEAQSFATRFTDLDRDGHPDLVISSDHRSSRLY